MNVLQRAGGAVTGPVRGISNGPPLSQRKREEIDPLALLSDFTDLTEQKGYVDADEEEEDNGNYSIAPIYKDIDFGRGSRQNYEDSTSSTPASSTTSSGTVVYGAKPRGKSSRVSGDNDVQSARDTHIVVPAPPMNRKPPPVKPVDPFATVSSPSTNQEQPQSSDAAANQRQAEELRQALAALEEAKQETEKLRQKPPAPQTPPQQTQPSSSGIGVHSSSPMEQQAALMSLQLEKQKQELQQLMESIQREKQDMLLKAEQIAAEKHRQQEEDSRRAERERDELRSALEVMQMQNQLLATRMEKSQMEAKQQLDLERAERILAVSRMESENRALLESQEKAQQELAKEREELRQAMKKMEHEKNELHTRVQATEERAKNEGILVEMQKAAFEESIKRLETEKVALAQRVEENENQSKLATEAVAVQLAKERDELRERMLRMEQDKEAIAKTLVETDLSAKAHAEQLAQQLAQERAELKESLERMENEKRDLVTHLSSAEKAAQAQAAALAEQLAKEKDELRQAMEKMEVEKQALAARLDDNEVQVQKASAQVAEQLAQERAELQQRLDAMSREKEELASQLAVTEQTAKKREEIMDERLKGEREELKLHVLKMKEEMLAERQAQLKEAAEAAAVAAAAAAAASSTSSSTIGSSMLSAMLQNHGNGIPGGLKPTKSLYDMLESMNTNSNVENLIESCAAAVTTADAPPPRTLGRKMSKQLSKHNMVPHNIGMIPEGKEDDENFMDTWSDTESVPGSRVGSRRPSLQSAIFLQAQERNRQQVEEQRNSHVDSGSTTPLPEQPVNSKPEEEIVASPPKLVMDEASLARLEKFDDDVKITSTPVQDEKEPRKDKKRRKEKPQKHTQPEPAPQKAEVDPFDDLPAPHAAAASGDVSRLEVLANLESSLLSSYDTAHRTPLFYASAYGQEAVATFLVKKSPEMIHELDIHGDSPLHAAASAGSVGCLDIILTALAGTDADLANPKNAMQMTPAHLAKSIDVLEVLFKHGADLQSVDANGRSPLFVACAMNREDCAEYIINCLDKEDRNLYHKDNRGDTPLHAAACNGAVDCLLLLLQFGVDPRITNKKGLKAVDLAIRNKQKKCKELLAEYHLHYCTGSDFDSVLFLATLEGHRQVKEHSSGKGGSGAYQIIKNQPLSANGGDMSNAAASSSFRTLRHAQSMFSLKTNQSLRLQKWGEWLAYEDQSSKSIYWYNHSTSTGQWEKPAEVLKLEQQQQQSGASSEHLGGHPHNMSMRLKKHGDWIEYATGSGRPFFYNEKNGEFQWEPPSGLVKPPITELSNTPATTTTSEVAASDGETWRPYKDPETGALFWYNHQTHVSQWEEPTELRTRSSNAAAGATAEDNDDHEAVHEVLNDDLSDLF